MLTCIITSLRLCARGHHFQTHLRYLINANKREKVCDMAAGAQTSSRDGGPGLHGWPFLFRLTYHGIIRHILGVKAPIFSFSACHQINDMDDEAEMLPAQAGPWEDYGFIIGESTLSHPPS
jgi:hypothetical protein